MPWFKKKKEISNPVKIDNGEEKRKEGRKVLYSVFQDTIREHNKSISEFASKFQLPNEDLVKFSQGYMFNVIHPDGELKTYERAKHFLKLQEKYKDYTIFSASALEKFTSIMYDKYSLRFRRDSLQVGGMNINDQIANDLMQAANILDANDGRFYLIWKRDEVRCYEDYKTIPDLFKVTGKFGEPQEIDYSDEKIVKEFKDHFNTNPTHYMHGNFQGIREGYDPIILAELKRKFYLEIGHMEVIPGSGDFSV